MRALQMTEWNHDPSFATVPEPEPGPGEVVLTMGGAGVCHSDLHLLYEFPADAMPWSLPMTLGHENAGWVHHLGPGVTGLEVGQAVAVYGPWGCGRCHACARGEENYCQNATVGTPVGGLGADGGMAEFMLVPGPRHLIPLPDTLAPAHAAPLTDAALTPYHAVNRARHLLVPGSTAVVIGIGGLGHLAVQILRATTAAQVVAVDVRPEALELAKSCGADHLVVAGDSAERPSARSPTAGAPTPSSTWWAATPPSSWPAGPSRSTATSAWSAWPGEACRCRCWGCRSVCR